MADGTQSTAQRYPSDAEVQAGDPRLGSPSANELLDVYQRTARRDRREAVSIDAFGVVLPAGADEATHDAIREDTRSLWRELNAGEVPWEQAVRAYDAAGLHGVVSGRMYRAGELNEELDAAVFKASLGEVLEPVEVRVLLWSGCSIAKWWTATCP